MKKVWAAALCTSVFLTACTSPEPTTTPSSETVQVAIQLSQGSASPIAQRIDLHRGQQLTMTITSDRDDELHVHGFDTTITIRSGQTVTESLVADRVGSYEIESHHPVYTILILQIR